ncbi:MAG: NAD-dependent epimerase/dehydratase family protein [Acidimicrobiales bacterium]
MTLTLVTEGRGFLGANLAAELRSRGHEVWTCDLKDGEDSQHIRADVSSFEQMSRIYDAHRIDLVYHLAAEYGRWNGEDHYQNLWRTNTIGTKNMLRLQERHLFRMVFFSSAEVYGDYDGLMTEDVMDRVAIKQMNDYAITKWAGELQCINSALMHGTETVRVRPVNCYGPHEYYSSYRGVIPVFAYRCIRGEPFDVYTGHKRIFDYVDDTVRTLANIADNFIPGEVYNIGSDEEWAIGIEDLAKMVVEETAADPSLARLQPSEAHTTKTKIVDFSKARQDLDHKATIDLEEGLRRYVQWMRTVYS